MDSSPSSVTEETPIPLNAVSIDQAMAMAMGLQRHKRLPEAEAIFRAILEAEPQHPDALHYLGVLRFQSGSKEEAIDLIQQAIAIHPQYADAYNNLGNVMRAMERNQEALEAFQKAVEFGPNMPEAHLNLAAMLRRCGRFPDAVTAYRTAIDLNPELGNAHLALGNALYTMGHIQEAAEAFRSWMQIDPANPVARHMAAACGAEAVPDRASDDFIRHSFDDFAESFEKKMQTLLYGAPELILAALHKHGIPTHPLEILDAGCGTGLCGPLLAPYAHHLIGVDLSAPMVEKARARNVYHELIVAELTSFLETTPRRFDLIASADTLVYFGSLSAVLNGAARSLREGGHLVFTVEAVENSDETPDFVLNPHGRYSHREAYLRQCLTNASLIVLEISRNSLRMERGQPVHGFIALARKPLINEGDRPHT